MLRTSRPDLMLPGVVALPSADAAATIARTPGFPGRCRPAD